GGVGLYGETHRYRPVVLAVARMDADNGSPLMPKNSKLDSTLDIELPLLMEAIYRRYSYDFRNYSMASQKRRILHAMRQLNCASVSELQARVLHEPEFFLRLLQYLTIPTTEMFR